MFGMSLTEILVVLVLLLVVVGPEKLPEMARTVGDWVREIRRATNLFRNTMMLEAEDPDRVDGAAAEGPIDLGAADLQDAAHQTANDRDGTDGRNRTRMHAVRLERPGRAGELRSIELPEAATTGAIHGRYLSPPHRDVDSRPAQ